MDVGIQPDGKIVIVGSGARGDRRRLRCRPLQRQRVARLHLRHNGEVTTPVIFVSSSYFDFADAVVIQPDGNNAVAGYTSTLYNGTNYDFAVVRYTANGDLDATFGAGGIVTTPIGPGDDVARAIAIQPDGKIVAAGASSNGVNDKFAVVRYTANGSLDATFGAGGIVTTPIGSAMTSRAG